MRCANIQYLPLINLICSDMGGRGGVYEGTEALNVAHKVMSSSSLDQPRDTLFASAVPSHSFVGSRGMLNFGAVNGENRLGNSFFQSLDQDESGDEILDEYFHPPEKKRRLSVEQVQFLEKSFDADNKLEPDMKVQLAKELSLHPRQVAIWFQNRRARWKTRQLETDYEALHANYESLKTEYDNILKENEKLKTEILCLKTNGLAGVIEKMNWDIKTTSEEAIAGMFSEDQESKVSTVASKSEEQSSTKSDLTYGESPLLADGIQSSLFETGDSSYALEINHSVLVENVEDEWNNELLQPDCIHLPSGSAFYYGFQVEDPCFSLWP